MSILGLYNYDPTIFDNMILPAVSDLPNDPDLFISDPEPINKDLLINNICMELAELSLIYSDPNTISKMISVWSAVHKNEWLNLWQTLLYKYNPIWNKDGRIVEESSGEGTTTNTGSYTDQKSGTDTIRDYVTGYDSNEYSPNGKTETEYGAGLTHTLNNMQSKSVGENSTTRTESGNIGVTTTQQMIREQREIVQFNMYSMITNSFKEQFCLMIY